MKTSESDEANSHPSPLTWSCDCEACNISWIQLPYGTLGDLAKAPQLGQNVLVTHQPWGRKERWASVQPGFTVQVLPQWPLGQAISFFQLGGGRGMSTVEAPGSTHGCWLLGKPETRPVLFCLWVWAFAHMSNSISLPHPPWSPWRVRVWVLRLHLLCWW